jgi:hypothetical protein
VFAGRARGRAAAVLEQVAASFEPLGYEVAERPGPLEARLVHRRGRPPLRLRFVERGRIFGGTIGLEISTAEPVLPEVAGGVTGHGRGVVRLRGISFRARGRDPRAAALAERLSADSTLVDALTAVHFERIRVAPDGRAVIRHIGGSVVWVIFPPIVHPVPFVPEQARATADALAAFAAAGARPG